MDIRKQVFLGLMVAMAVAIGFIETMIPLPVPLPGARLAMIVSLKTIKSASLIGISFIGSFFHNIGQIATAIVMVHNMGLLAYLPLLLLLGLFTGYFVGLAASYASRHLEKIGVRL